MMRGLSSALCGLLLLAAAAAWADGPEFNISGSAYVDYWALSDSRARQNSLGGITPELAVKLDADVHETLSVSVRTCFGCHGLEVERASLDFTPKGWFNVQAGRLPIPFGEFSTRSDPANHRTTSKPLIFEMGRMAYFNSAAFNLGVVPAPYVDTGALVYGQVWPSENVQVWYGGYVVAGMKGNNDIDYSSMHTSFYIDNNRVPSGGGRVVMTYSSPSADAWVRDFSLGVSGMHGRYDPNVSRSHTALGLDASVRIKKLTLRGEAAASRIDIDPTAAGYRFQIIDPYIEKSGFYVEAEHPIGERLKVVYRLDGLRRAGIPLPGADPGLSIDSKILRYTQGFEVSIWKGLYAKASYEFWYLTDFPSFHAGHVGVGGTF